MADNIVFGLSVTPEKLEWILSAGIFAFFIGHIVNWLGDRISLNGWDVIGGKDSGNAHFDSGSKTNFKKIYEIFDKINLKFNESGFEGDLNYKISDLMKLLNKFQDDKSKFTFMLHLYFWGFALFFPILAVIYYFHLALSYG
ncbi:hypothetical protein [Monaibacterium marinum]|uniref:hypothetical protein n=1 Tax=Pontivivens marinum TaxID=1690039 RepID=UPI0011AF304E|nr:hypothetical protein [Monaibacterium marinum]